MNKDELKELFLDIENELSDYHSQAESDASNFQYRLSELMDFVQQSDEISEEESSSFQSFITEAINTLEYAGAEEFHNASCELADAQEV